MATNYILISICSAVLSAVFAPLSLVCDASTQYVFFFSRRTIIEKASLANDRSQLNSALHL